MSGLPNPKGHPALATLRAMSPSTPKGLARPQGNSGIRSKNKFPNLANLLFTKTPQVKGLVFNPGAKFGTSQSTNALGQFHALKTLGGSFR